MRWVLPALLLGIGTARAQMSEPFAPTCLQGATCAVSGSNLPGQAATNAALKAMAAGAFPVVYRAGYSAAGDGGAMTYVWSSSTCSLNSGAGDNGSQVAPNSGTGCWLAAAPEPYSVLIFGADKTGASSSTAAVQAALGSGVTALYFPPGSYQVCGVVVPSTSHLVIYGNGVASQLVQPSGCSSPIFSWAQTAIAYTEGYIRDLLLDGTSGAADLIDTRGVGGITLQNLYVNNIPTGKDAILIDGAASTYTHDDRILNLQVYSTTAGHAAVRFGPYSSDDELSNFIMNGNFEVAYSVYMDNGATTLKMSNSHPYNVTTNIVYSAGGASNLLFSNNTFDNAQGDLVALTGATNSTFTHNLFEAIQASHSGATLASTNAVSFVNNQFSASSGAAAAVTETGTANNTTVTGGNVGTIANYTAPFAFVGSQSYATAVAGYNPLGIKTSFSGATQSPQAQNTTQYLGVNGAQSAAVNTVWVAPQNLVLTTAVITVDQTPASGQTFTFTVYDGSTVLGTATISNGSYSATLALNKSVAAGDQIYIKSVFSATSGSANVRYYCNFTG